MNDSISRQAAIDALDCINGVEEVLRSLPSAQPDNQINLCDSCDYLYPDCPAKNDDVIFGNGIGNDNICACNKYKPFAQPEQRWISCSERLPKVGERVLAQQINGAMQVMKCIDGGHLKWFYSRTVAWMPLPEPYRGGDE